MQYVLSIKFLKTRTEERGGEGCFKLDIDVEVRLDGKGREIGE